MGAFTAEFVNITQAAAGFIPALGDGVSNVLPSIISALALLGPLGTNGGYIYFPPGRYRVGVPAPLNMRWMSIDASADAGPTLGFRVARIPTNVDLFFAPGATLVLDPFVHLEIAGGI